jgi:hypothetical protein
MKNCTREAIFEPLRVTDMRNGWLKRDHKGSKQRGDVAKTGMAHMNTNGGVQVPKARGS